jgi:hypothetical protein
MEVPLSSVMAVSEEYQEEGMLLPGAKRSRQGPKLEKLLRMSLEVVAPTTIASRTREGDLLQAEVFSLPAATV